MDAAHEADRRTTERFSASYGVRFEIDGYTQSMNPFFATGTTLNISRGGLMARVDRPLPLGVNCTILFDEHDVVEPSRDVAGKVVRSDRGTTGCFVAIEFDVPLERVVLAEREEEAAV
jgi:hypothetical protein